MRRLILLLRRIYLPLLFFIFEAVAINFYANSSDLAGSRLAGISNHLFGWGHEGISTIKSYFSLGRENDRLTGEIAALRQRLGAAMAGADSLELAAIWEGDSLGVIKPYYPYLFSGAKVINNSINRRRNFITIDKGLRDGIKPNMAVLTTEGSVVGYVADCSDRFSVCVSILNTDFRSSGMIKGGEAFGPILWSGEDTERIALTDIPKYVEINRGDTILTTNFSSIFPPGMMIGTVESHHLTESMLYRVEVNLAARIASISHVLVVDYTDAQQRRELEVRASAPRTGTTRAQ